MLTSIALQISLLRSHILKITSLFIAILGLTLLSSVRVHAQGITDKVYAEIIEQSGVTDFFIRLESHAPIDPSLMPSDKAAKGLLVYETLVNHATLTQAELISFLDEKHLKYRQFAVENVVWVQDYAPLELVMELAGFDHVEFISPNEILERQRVRHAPGVVRAGEPEWGIAHIHADSVWKLGFTGQGVVVGGQDTGYEWDHPAISKQYRGNSGGEVDHNYNWYDAIHELSPVHDDTIMNPLSTPCGIDATEPCDDSGHGTHTMGTIVGQDGDNLIGVAPDAQWVGVRCMDRGYGSPMTYLEAFEWFLAPTDVNGENPDPTLAPHVINNSWRCPEMEGCNPQNFSILEQAVNNLRAAGVVVVVSAGNNGGSGCGSVDSPPAIFTESFTVGAIRPNDTIAGFSSRGPVMVDSSGRIKPDIAAPGTIVRSAWLDSTYRSLNGTSMAGPHVVGTVALMISANPSLAGDVGRIEEIIRETARQAKPLYSCAMDSLEIPNNTYGYGIIDALAAVEMALESTSTGELITNGTELRLFPNPSDGLVNYIVPSEAGDRIDIRVFDMQGSEVLSVSNRMGFGALDLSREGPGIYGVIVVNKTTGVSAISKVVIGRNSP